MKSIKKPILRELIRLLVAIWTVLYHSFWRRVLGQGHHHLLGWIHIIALHVTLSPYRAITYLFLFWLGGVAGVYYLEKNDFLVMNLTENVSYLNKNTEIKNKSDLTEAMKVIKSSDELEIGSFYLFESSNMNKIKIAQIKQYNEKYIAANEISCKGSIKPPTFSLDLLFPIFKIGQSSSCTLKNDAPEWIKFFYVLYPILGVILTGLTLFSWAGILQNRLSRK